ncbi:hypothetical protein [Paenibacillus mendelii]|uniref:Spore coat protein D n=1 Tax=Paenibacillus mendelii TaxID=206163 RepID=A0ABV6J9I0_9BACL|nr:hypothetical protein [Paenibacillus mendelii]MCQ6559536.1 hypothetical protein [Paenibacillus mendelii]
MSCHPICPTATIFDPPVRIERDFFYPQLVQVIHPVEIVNRRHYVPVYQHCFQYIEREETGNNNNNNNTGGSNYMQFQLSGSKAKKKTRSRKKR